MNHMKLRSLCEGAVLVAVAQILSYLKLWEMPWGGSVVLSMIPLVRLQAVLLSDMKKPRPSGGALLRQPGERGALSAQDPIWERWDP